MIPKPKQTVSVFILLHHPYPVFPQGTAKDKTKGKKEWTGCNKMGD